MTIADWIEVITDLIDGMMIPDLVEIITNLIEIIANLVEVIAGLIRDIKKDL
jgi:hypothetical protein